jgi:ABC-type glycerol-3-phosphate transport system substrate-binding protein
MRCVRRWFALAVTVLVLAACSSSKDFDLAQAEVVHFRELMAAQEFEKIYSEGSDELKKTTTVQNMVRLLGAIDRKLGAVKKATGNGWNVNYNPSGTSVTLKFKTEFEKGKGDETFVYRLAGGKALLSGYHINSEDLIAN